MVIHFFFPDADADVDLDSEEDDDVFTPEDTLRRIVEDQSLGELDGDELGENDAYIDLYGPSGEAIVRAILPALKNNPLTRKAIIRRSGAAPVRVDATS